MAWPMPTLTGRGKARKSLRDDPTHLTGLTRPNSIIPLYVYLYNWINSRPPAPQILRQREQIGRRDPVLG